MKLRFVDSNNYAVMLDFRNIDYDESGADKIGKMYKFEPITAVIKKNCYDEADLHYLAKNPKELKKGTKVIIDTYWLNFYGHYFRINYEGEQYDIKVENVLFS